jgi:hypothetical protein
MFVTLEGASGHVAFTKRERQPLSRSVADFRLYLVNTQSPIVNFECVRGIPAVVTFSLSFPFRRSTDLLEGYPENHSAQ